MFLIIRGETLTHHLTQAFHLLAVSGLGWNWDSADPNQNVFMLSQIYYKVFSNEIEQLSLVCRANIDAIGQEVNERVGGILSARL